MLYTVHGFILSHTHIRDAQYRIEIFTKEYGKISGFVHHKKNESLDICMGIEASVERKGKYNTFKNCTVVGYVPREEVEAKKLLQLLEFFMLLKYLLPDGEVFLQIYETIEQLLLHFPNSHFQKSTQILLHQLGYIGNADTISPELLPARISHILHDLGYTFSYGRYSDSSFEVLPAYL